MKRAVLLLALAVGFAGGLRAQQTPAGAEAEKARPIADLLQRAKPQGISGAVQASGVCIALIESLAAASPEVQFLEPVVRTADPSHPELSNHRRCGPLTKVTAEHPFRLYRFISDDSQAREYLYEGSLYVSRDFDRCSLRDEVSVALSDESHNALIRFRGGWYVFDLRLSPPRPGYQLQLWQFDFLHNGFRPACAIDTRPRPKRQPHPHDFVRPY